MAAVVDEIERPAALLLGDGATDELVALASIAISLKRVADLTRDVTDDLGANAQRSGFIGRLCAGLDDMLSDRLHDLAQKLRP